MAQAGEAVIDRQEGTVAGESRDDLGCKRDSFLAVLEAVDFVEEHFGVKMERTEIVCGYAAGNRQCVGKRCPFSRANR